MHGSRKNAPSSIVVLTGAGISAESGVATFRDKGGIWAKVDYRDVATPQGFARNPTRVHEFYNERRRRIADYEPNAAHFAVARLERDFPGDFLLVTQNVDPLHEKAGSRKLVHMHGQHSNVLCANCGDRRSWRGDLSTELVCETCQMKGTLRPDVVWFGETPYHMQRISAALAACDLFISIGTSGNVYPAAGFVEQARMNGAHTVELNLEPSAGRSHFAEARQGPATEQVPAYVGELLASMLE
ncbi:MAG: NAD-dependent deacylase [Rhizobiaceae bacterium]